MNTLSIADFTSAGAECGDAGINLASLELTGIAPVGRDPDPDVVNRPTAPARAWAFLLADDYGRDPDKYTWLEHDLPRPAPRIPRSKPQTYGVLAVWIVIFGSGISLWAWAISAVCGWLARVVG